MLLSRVKLHGKTSNGDGAGIGIVGGTATIVNWGITGNNINNSWKYSGAIANSGTLNPYFSTIADNYAHDGGGLNAGIIANTHNNIIWGNDIDG